MRSKNKFTSVSPKLEGKLAVAKRACPGQGATLGGNGAFGLSKCNIPGVL